MPVPGHLFEQKAGSLLDEPATADAAAGHEQEPQLHTVEEVVAVQDGAATFFLGEQQARIVRAGQIVRIPAGVSHRWVAEPSGVRAVAAYGAAQIVTQPA